MILDKELEPYVLFHEESLRTGIQRFVENRANILCVIDAHNVLHGLFTNGDFVRWALRQGQSIDLSLPVSEIVNYDFIYATESDPPERVETMLERVKFVPIVDEQRRLVAMARRREREMKIGEHYIAYDEPAFIIAEIGNNHNGSLSLAKQLIDAAAEAGANCAKFQMRDLPTLYVNAGDADDSSENLGSQYTLDLLSRFQLAPDEMLQAFDYCKERGIMPLCTPWDLTSLRRLSAYGMPAYKVASADMTNHELLRAMAALGKPLICSTGMSDEGEIYETVELLQRLGAQYALLQVNSTYPTPFKDVNLRYMNRLAEIGNCFVGYSGHERGYAVPLAAVAMGAKIIEKHITLDRGMEGNDHKVSLLPHEFKAMVSGIRDVETALGSDAPRQLTQGERINRADLAKSLVITQDLAAGEIITAEMVAIKSPGRGLQPNRFGDLVGRTARRDFKAGDFFYPSDIGRGPVVARHYHFKRPWGIPVRFYDYKALLAKSNPDFLEFHLSYKDMDLNPQDFFDGEALDIGLVVHSPDLFAGDHILNLASDDEAYRQRSIEEVQRVVDLTRELKPYFKRAERPLVIVSLGGFTKDGFIPAYKRPPLYARVAEGLAQVDSDGVEIIPQTVAPYPWFFGGQLYLNLFVSGAEAATFCREYGYRMCFDTSHSRLACNLFHWSFQEYVDAVGPYVAHLHLVDAAGVDNEGLQIGEGDIDFPALARQLNQHAPEASFIPEIWQGHENEGEGFWLAAERLEGLF